MISEISLLNFQINFIDQIEESIIKAFIENLSMQKQNKKSQQSLLTQFIRQKQFAKKQEINSDLSKSEESQSQQEKQKNSQQQLEKQVKPMYNVEFYRNQRTSQPNGDYIDKIHSQWWDNFNLLQKHHGFIQWLFPNSFTSRFNSQAFALTKEQQDIFRKDMMIAKRYVMSYQMMLRFYGMKLKSKESGQIVRARDVGYKSRYVATLLTSFHNHMRITRILCSLTMVGFGRYAKQLSKFLNEQIYGQNGEMKALAKYNVDKDWKDYQNYVESYQDLNIFLRYYVDNPRQVEQKTKLQIQAKEKQEKKRVNMEKNDPKPPRQKN